MAAVQDSTYFLLCPLSFILKWKILSTSLRLEGDQSPFALLALSHSSGLRCCSPIHTQPKPCLSPPHVTVGQPCYFDCHTNNKKWEKSKQTTGFHMQGLALKHRGEPPPHQLHTWGAKAPSKTRFSFPTALLGAFSEQLRYLPHWMWGHLGTVAVERLENRSVVKSFNLWPIVAAVFLLFLSTWGWGLSFLDLKTAVTFAPAKWFSSPAMISYQSLRQHLRFFPLSHLYAYTYTYMKSTFHREFSFLKGFPAPASQYNSRQYLCHSNRSFKSKVCVKICSETTLWYVLHITPGLQVRVHFKYEILNEIITVKSLCCHSNTNSGWQSSHSMMSPTLPCCCCEPSPARINFFWSMLSINIYFYLDLHFKSSVAA